MAGRPRSVLYKPTADSILAEVERRKGCPWYTYFPTEGPLRRELYPKHIAFFAAGAKWRQRALLAANRSGKTQSAAYELVCHLTGEYPSWWIGRRFDKPVECWGAGDTGQTTRNILQVALLGPTSVIDNRQWAGMIPAAMVYDISRKAGIPDAVSTIWIRHASGGISTIDLLSYDQKREAFQGTAKHVIWLDEECPPDVYGECLMRTMTTDGLVMVTFTPLQGLTPFIADWLSKSVLEVIDPTTGQSQLAPARQEVFGGDMGDVEKLPQVDGEQAGLTRYTVMATWDDCPHLSASAKDEMLREFPAYQRDARSRGIPALGSGTIYPIPESEIRCAPFEIPAHWPRAFALDTGWDWTAAIWIAVDRESQTVYAYSVYKRGHAEVPIHAEAIRSRGAWIPGVGDAAAITNQDGRQFVDIYRQHGLDLQLADKSVEAGIQDVWTRLSAGKLKVFSSCGPLFDEYRLYRRDDKGRIVKQNDHLCDCLRMAIRSGVARARVQRPDGGDVATVLDAKTADTNWMQG